MCSKSYGKKGRNENAAPLHIPIAFESRFEWGNLEGKIGGTPSYRLSMRKRSYGSVKRYLGVGAACPEPGAGRCYGAMVTIDRSTVHTAGSPIWACDHAARVEGKIRPAAPPP
jgi:hypothetical protein